MTQVTEPPFAGITWVVTPELRWRTAPGGAIRYLEQAWRCVESGAIDWRRVPSVTLPLPVGEP